MTYLGDWGKLNENLERVKHNVAQRKARGGIIESASTKEQVKAASKRKSISLVSRRRNEIKKIRLVLLVIILIAMASFYYFL